MICTSSHNSCNTDLYQTYAISGNRGKDAFYEGDCYPALAPKHGFWKEWHENIGKIDELENNRFYIERFFIEVLSKLDPFEVYQELDESILLCYEDNDEFCHRHIVAAWFKLFLGIDVPEVRVYNDEIYEVPRPMYIGGILDQVIRKYYNLGKHESIQGFYLRTWGNALKESNPNISKLLLTESVEIDEDLILWKK